MERSATRRTPVLTFGSARVVGTASLQRGNGPAYSQRVRSTTETRSRSGAELPPCRQLRRARSSAWMSCSAGESDEIGIESSGIFDEHCSGESGGDQQLRKDGVLSAVELRQWLADLDQLLNEEPAAVNGIECNDDDAVIVDDDDGRGAELSRMHAEFVRAADAARRLDFALRALQQYVQGFQLQEGSRDAALLREAACACLSAGYPRRAAVIYDAAVNARVNLSPQALSDIAAGFARAGWIKTAVDIVLSRANKSKLDAVVMDETLLSDLILALGARGELDAAFEVFEGRLPSLSSASTSVEISAQTQREISAKATSSAVVCASAASAVYAASDVDMAGKNRVDLHRNEGERELDVVVRLVQEQGLEWSEEVLVTLVKHELLRELGAARRAGGVADGARQVLRKMRDCGVCAGVDVVNAAAARFGRARDSAAAASVMQQTAVFQALVNRLEREAVAGNQAQAAKSMLEIVLEMASTSGRTSSAPSSSPSLPSLLPKSATSRSPAADAGSILVLAEACAYSGECVLEALALIEHAKVALGGGAHNEQHFWLGRAMLAASTGQDPSDALLHMHAGGVRLERDALLRLLRLLESLAECAQASEEKQTVADSALRLLRVATQRHGLRTDQRTYLAVLKVLCASGHAKAAATMLDDMLVDAHERPELAVTGAAYALVLRACAANVTPANSGAIGRAESVVDDMNSRAIVPTDAVWCALIDCYARALMLEKALDVFHSIESPSKMLCETMVSCCLQHPRGLPHAVAILEQMRTRNMQTDSAFFANYDQMLLACASAADFAHMLGDAFDGLRQLSRDDGDASAARSDDDDNSGSLSVEKNDEDGCSQGSHDVGEDGGEQPLGRRRRKDRWEMSDETIGAVIRACQDNEDMPSYKQALESMRMHGLRPSQAVLDYFAADGKSLPPRGRRKGKKNSRRFVRELQNADSSAPQNLSSMGGIDTTFARSSSPSSLSPLHAADSLVSSPGPASMASSSPKATAGELKSDSMKRQVAQRNSAMDELHLLLSGALFQQKVDHVEDNISSNGVSEAATRVASSAPQRSASSSIESTRAIQRAPVRYNAPPSASSVAPVPSGAASSSSSAAQVRTSRTSSSSAVADRAGSAKGKPVRSSAKSGTGGGAGGGGKVLTQRERRQLRRKSKHLQRTMLSRMTRAADDEEEDCSVVNGTGDGADENQLSIPVATVLARSSDDDSSGTEGISSDTVVSRDADGEGEVGGDRDGRKRE